MKPPAHKTENADPHEQHNPVPKVVLALVCGLLVWAVSYIAIERADGSAALGDRRDVAALAASAGQGTVADGKQLFAANCQACHQASGQGIPGVFPPLAGSPWVTGEPDRLAQILLHGMTGPLDVLGTTYNGAMPAFGEQFSDAEIAALATHIRGQWGNGAAPVEAAQVAAARAASTAQKEPWHGGEALQAFIRAGGAAKP